MPEYYNFRASVGKVFVFLLSVDLHLVLGKFGMMISIVVYKNHFSQKINTGTYTVVFFFNFEEYLLTC